MNVRRLHLRNFMCHADTVLDLPERGVAVLVGENGSGKSSVVEAVAVALFGETLRGTDPWRAGGEEGAVHAVVAGAWPTSLGAASELDVVRERSAKGRTSLSWLLNVGEATTYETTTKAQAALEAALGTNFDVWRRTATFSSQDAAHFTLATDGERKRLLETILGLDRLDAAHERARAALRAATDEAALAEREHALTVVRLEEVSKRLASAARALAALPSTEEPTALVARIEQLGKLKAGCVGDLAGLYDRKRAADLGQAKLDAAARECENRSANLAALGICPVCEQTVPQALKTRAGVEAMRASGVAGRAGLAGAAALLTLVEQIAELEQERTGIEVTLGEAMTKLGAARRGHEERARWERERDEASVAHGRLVGLAGAFAKGCAKAERERKVAAACVEVLGLRGVRAHVLGRALAGLEAVANLWLARIAGAGLRLRLRSTIEKKAGGVTDAIGLVVEGAGGGHGYAASSGGERRRIDVALMLALAEVAAGAHGTTVGTIFADQIDDHLDDAGVVAVAGALRSLAEDRAVVVITHNPAMLAELRGARQWRVEDGRVCET